MPRLVRSPRGRATTVCILSCWHAPDANRVQRRIDCNKRSYLTRVRLDQNRPTLQPPSPLACSCCRHIQFATHSAMNVRGAHGGDTWTQRGRGRDWASCSMVVCSNYNPLYHLLVCLSVCQDRCSARLSLAMASAIASIHSHGVRSKAARIGSILDELYPETPIPLQHASPFQVERHRPSG